MGNKLCKKKSDNLDCTDAAAKPNKFDRIITRLHLRPNSWKSESHLNQKQKTQTVIESPLSKSSDWTEVALEVPEKESSVKQSIFNDDKGTPTPPPRKHKKGFREKIEAVAKSSIQAFTPTKKPVEEPLFIKKKIDYSCPICDADESHHNRDHHHHQHNQEKNEEKIKSSKQELKRKKNLSVISLPNYNELKLTVTSFDDIDKSPEKRNSLISVPESKKLFNASSTGKLDNYITRCRSFGSLLPQQLMTKLKTKKVPTDIESDDSFGGLEDWDLKFIENYNPKDASLPRTRKNILSDIESLIVQEEKPKPPVRKSESLVKRLSKERKGKQQSTPPSTPEIQVEERLQPLDAKQLPVEENGKVEHSTLMKILEEYSIRDKMNQDEGVDKTVSKYTNKSDLEEKHLDRFDKFIDAEKTNTNEFLYNRAAINEIS